MAYDVNNPHPGFGKDKNILNEFGHTRYPRYVEHPTEKTKEGFPVRVIVADAKEEEALLGKKAAAANAKGWGKPKPEAKEEE